jgi:hypothetical protein
MTLDTQLFFTPSACEAQQENAIYEPGSGTFPDNKSAGTLTLDFPASSSVRNKSMLYQFKSTSQFIFVIAAQTD